MDTKSVYRELFSTLVNSPQRDFDLARGALYIAAEDYPAVDVEESTSMLDNLAGEVRERLEPSMDLPAKLRALSSYLGDTQGYSSDEDHFNPRNLYLDQVLARRKGMPIALSLVYSEVGARLGMLFRNNRPAQPSGDANAIPGRGHLPGPLSARRTHDQGRVW